jgi:hypothetical protein
MEREGVQYAVSLFTRSEGPNRNILNAHGRSCEENPPKLSPGEIKINGSSVRRAQHARGGTRSSVRCRIRRPVSTPSHGPGPRARRGAWGLARLRGPPGSTWDMPPRLDGETRGRNLLPRWRLLPASALLLLGRWASSGVQTCFLCMFFWAHGVGFVVI